MVQDNDGVQVANVSGPVSVPLLRSEGHLLPRTAAGLRPRQAIEPAVEGEYPAAGARAKVYAELLEGGVDAELAEFGVALQIPHGRDRPERHLADAGRPAAGPVLETFRSLLYPPPEH